MVDLRYTLCAHARQDAPREGMAVGAGKWHVPQNDFPVWRHDAGNFTQPLFRKGRPLDEQLMDAPRSKRQCVDAGADQSGNQLATLRS